MLAIRDNAQKRSEREQLRKVAFDSEVGANEGDTEDDKDGSRKLRTKRKEPGSRGAEVMEVDDEGGKGGLRSGTAKAKRILGRGFR